MMRLWNLLSGLEDDGVRVAIRIAIFLAEESKMKLTAAALCKALVSAQDERGKS